MKVSVKDTTTPDAVGVRCFIREGLSPSPNEMKIAVTLTSKVSSKVTTNSEHDAAKKSCCIRFGSLLKLAA